MQICLGQSKYLVGISAGKYLGPHWLLLKAIEWSTDLENDADSWALRLTFCIHAAGPASGEKMFAALLKYMNL
jgi:hypothetical protein